MGDMINVTNEIAAIDRKVGKRAAGEREVSTVLLRRTYRAPIDDVWDAVTDPKRISRWFLPVTGDLRLGGRYQTEGNAGGEILQCEPPRMFKVTWIFGEQAEGDISEVEVRLSPGAAGETVFELEHSATVDPQFWEQYGPGAVGVGWDGALFGLGSYLAGVEISDEEKAALMESPEIREFNIASAKAWGKAYKASGATDAAVEKSIQATTEFYVPPAA